MPTDHKTEYKRHSKHTHTYTQKPYKNTIYVLEWIQFARFGIEVIDIHIITEISAYNAIRTAIAIVCPPIIME